MSDSKGKTSPRDGEFILWVTATKEEDGGFVAKASRYDIFAQGNTWEELCESVREVAKGDFFDSPVPTKIFLQLIEKKMMVHGKRGTVDEVEGPFLASIATKLEVLTCDE